jgi:uncharacterized protein (TIGR00369 family)
MVTAIPDLPSVLASGLPIVRVPAMTSIPEGFEPAPEPSDFLDLVGPFYIRVDGDRLVTGLRCLQKHANKRGIVHGGMLVTLADTGMGRAARHQLGPGLSATIGLNSEFLAPARPGDWIECHAEIVRATRALVFVEAVIRRGDRPLLAANGIWKRSG